MKLLVMYLIVFLSSFAFIGCFNEENGVSPDTNAPGAENLLVRLTDVPIFARGYTAIVIVSRTDNREIINYKKTEEPLTQDVDVRLYVSQRPYDVFVILAKSHAEIEIGSSIDQFISNSELSSYIYSYSDSRIFENFIVARNWQFLADFLGVELPTTKIGGVNVRIENSVVRISWNEVEQAASYEVFYAEGGFATTLDTKVESTSTETSIPIGNFTAGQMYTFAVVAILDDGSRGEISEPFSIMIPE